MKINSLLVEGGAELVTSFLADDLWDHYTYFQGNMLIGVEGLSAMKKLDKKIVLWNRKKVKIMR